LPEGKDDYDNQEERGENLSSRTHDR